MENVSIIRSNRKTISIEIRSDQTILVRAPKRASLRAIQYFLEEKSDWINKHLEKMKEKEAQYAHIEPLTDEEYKRVVALAKDVIPIKVAHFANLMGINYGRITIRNQKTRWGSCSSKGNLNFNCLLMLTPDEVIDYVVVHELCHRREMNHSKQFWNLVQEALPDYKIAKKWLNENGTELMKRGHLQ